MSDEQHREICGWTKLFHPRGPQVTLPLPADPTAAFAAVTAALDAGWLVQAPGLEEGEEKEQVGYVLKSVFSNESTETPFVLLYSTNDALKWSFLKVYLNTDQDRAAFEFASKTKLADLPEYVGQDKPQRGANHRTDTYIVPAPRPFGVVLKKNPKHNPSETDPKKKKPARLFVRWADAAPREAPEAGVISEAQTNELTHLLSDLSALGHHVKLGVFCNIYGVDALWKIPASRFNDARTEALRAIDTQKKKNAARAAKEGGQVA